MTPQKFLLLCIRRWMNGTGNVGKRLWLRIRNKVAEPPQYLISLFILPTSKCTCLIMQVHARPYVYLDCSISLVYPVCCTYLCSLCLASLLHIHILVYLPMAIAIYLVFYMHVYYLSLPLAKPNKRKLKWFCHIF